MRSCQVCGCASWGPIGNPAELDRLGEFVPTVDAAFVRCDNCKAIARADLLQDAASITPPDAEFPGLGGFMKTAMPALGALLPSMPAPSTRLERLTVALVRADFIDKWEIHTAQDIVSFARDLEIALDEPVESGLPPRKPWLMLSFPTREEFERWVTGFMDKVVYPGTVIDAQYPQELYDRSVAYVQQ